MSVLSWLHSGRVETREQKLCLTPQRSFVQKVRIAAVRVRIAKVTESKKPGNPRPCSLTTCSALLRRPAWWSDMPANPITRIRPVASSGI